MQTPPIVSAEEWAAARARMLVKEKADLRAHDASATDRWRLPCVNVEKDDVFDRPGGRIGLAELFAGRDSYVPGKPIDPAWDKVSTAGKAKFLEKHV